MVRHFALSWDWDNVADRFDFTAGGTAIAALGLHKNALSFPYFLYILAGVPQHLFPSPRDS